MVLVAGLMFATLFAYISGAPFILQGMFGLSPQQFGLAFSVNAVGLILMTQLNPILVKRYGPVRVAVGGGADRPGQRARLADDRARPASAACSAS